MKTKNYIRWHYFLYIQSIIGSLFIILFGVAFIIMVNCLGKGDSNEGNAFKLMCYLLMLFGVYYFIIPTHLAEGFLYYISISDQYIFNKHGSWKRSIYFYGQYKTKVEIRKILSIEFEYANVDSKGREPGCNERENTFGRVGERIYTDRRIKQNPYLLIKTIDNHTFRFNISGYSLKQMNMILDDLFHRMHVLGNESYLKIDKSKIIAEYKKVMRDESLWILKGYETKEDNTK